MNLEFLSSVQKPSRYINSEWNSTHKKHIKDIVKVCLCFPDLYEVGASNLGIEILYHIINKRQDSLAERVYCPDIDLENILLKENIPLFSLESNTSIKDFDIVGFSLQYELSFTNVLNMLHIAQIPLFRNDRKNIFPLVISGGPVCSNPGPVKDFFDFFVLGEAEDVIGEILDVVQKFKKIQITKEQLLLEFSKIEGIYVPGYEKQKVKSLIVDVKNSFYPVQQIVPYVQTIHNRFNVEITRGCVYKCKFCQASVLYRPWRERDFEKIISTIEEGIKNTGYEEISLGSFSLSNYSKIEDLLKETEKFSKKTHTFISVPSLRCNSKSIKLLKYLIYPHRTNLTFAIESGSENLRKFICKEITDIDIFNTINYAKSLGWKLLKLYFMIGLPTEKKEDIVAIVDLIKKIKKYIPGINLNITISPFVPKPHTQFQFEEQENIKSLQEKISILRKNLKGVNFKIHNLYISYLEGIFSRGDEKLSKVIYRAWSKGAKFDQWKERFNFSIWEETFKECSVEPDQYLLKREQESSLPWSNLFFS